jgi:hypothetical protein
MGTEDSRSLATDNRRGPLMVKFQLKIATSGSA